MSLSDRLAAPEPVPWKPSVGDIIEGTVVEVRETEGQFSPYPMLFLRCADGHEQIVHAFHAALNRELRDQGVKVGDLIAIKHLGTMPGKNWVGYRVLVEHASTTEAVQEQPFPGSSAINEDGFGEAGDDNAPSAT